MKGHDERGFVFYTNLDSRKGGELAANPQRRLALPLEVASPPGADRRAGRAGRARPRRTPISPPAARDSQLGAWASDQSRPLDARATFEARYEEVRRRFEGGEVPRPPRWSGWRVAPERIEFWTDRAHRLHERRLFTRAGEGWSEGLLYP